MSYEKKSTKVKKGKNKKLEMLEEDQEAIVLCLALGTLEAINCGSWPLEAGVWTLARPAFWEPLKKTNIPKEIIEILSSCDELDSLKTLAGKDKANQEIEKMIFALRSRLASLSDKSWCASWS